MKLICHQCQKSLNDMTLLCDRCGTKLKVDKKPVSYSDLQSQIIDKDDVNSFESEFERDIKRAHYLSTLYGEESSGNKKKIKEYLNYIYLRIIYDRDKLLLLTRDYSVPKAKVILSSLVNYDSSKDLNDFLEEEFGDDYINNLIPQSVIKRVPLVYITEYRINKILPQKNTLGTFISICSNIIASAIVLAFIAVIAIGGILYYQGNDLANLVTEGVEFIRSYIVIIYVLIGLSVIRGLYKGFRNKKHSLFSSVIRKNTHFNKHTQTECKKRLKSLNYRIKKGTA